ncbi:UDP-N-acetylmuramoyl-tripeptide--D-alanyl-D-alanine ligase [Aurantivibrio infirmus]
MMKSFALHEVVEKTEGRLINGDCEFDHVSTDTRAVQSGDLFVALRGEKFDAHQFLQQAVEKNVSGLVVEQVDKSIGLPQLVVSDSTIALGKLAQINRENFLGKVIGITGSCGKTTVKTMLRNILSCKGSVHATEGNFNNHIGVPLTLFAISPQHQYSVIEMGASAPGEIAYLADLAKPDVAVITNVLRAHVEGFGSIEAVAKAKGEIFSQLSPKGTAVINLDDRFAHSWVASNPGKKLVTFSCLTPTADFFAKNISVLENGNIGFEMVMFGEQLEIELAMLGKQNVANALAAAACAYAVGASGEDIKNGLQGTRAVNGRMQSMVGKSGSLIIDDSYNANPDSVQAAINALVSLQRESILVLGDLAELGADSNALHQSLGAYAKAKKITELLTVGDEAQFASEKFNSEKGSLGQIAKHFSSQEELISYLLNRVEKNSAVLIKGSRVSHMERVVAALTDADAVTGADAIFGAKH